MVVAKRVNSWLKLPLFIRFDKVDLRSVQIRSHSEIGDAIAHTVKHATVRLLSRRARYAEA